MPISQTILVSSMIIGASEVSQILYFVSFRVFNIPVPSTLESNSPSKKYSNILHLLSSDLLSYYALKNKTVTKTNAFVCEK